MGQYGYRALPLTPGGVTGKAIEIAHSQPGLPALGQCRIQAAGNAGAKGRARRGMGRIVLRMDCDKLADIGDELRTMAVKKSGYFCVKGLIHHGLFLQAGQLSQGVGIDTGCLDQLVDIQVFLIGMGA